MNTMAHLAIALSILYFTGCGPLDEGHKKQFNTGINDKRRENALSVKLKEAHFQLEKSSEALLHAKNASEQMTFERDEAMAKRNQALALLKAKVPSDCEALKLKLSEAEAQAHACSQANSHLSGLKAKEHKRAEHSIAESAKLAEEYALKEARLQEELKAHEQRQNEYEKEKQQLMLAHIQALNLSNVELENIAHERTQAHESVLELKENLNQRELLLEEYEKKFSQLDGDQKTLQTQILLRSLELENLKQEKNSMAESTIKLTNQLQRQEEILAENDNKFLLLDSNNQSLETQKSELEKSNLELSNQLKSQEEILVQNDIKLLELDKEKQNLESQKLELERGLQKSLREIKQAQEETKIWQQNHDLIQMQKAEQKVLADERQEEVVRLQKLLEKTQNDLALRIEASEELSLQIKKQNQALSELEQANLAVTTHNLSLTQKLEQATTLLEQAETNKEISLEENLDKHMPSDDMLSQSFRLEMNIDEEKFLSHSDFFGIKSEEIEQDINALITYEKRSEEVKLGINPILSKNNYEAILHLNDLSYAVAKEITVTDDFKLPLVKKRIIDTQDELIKTGWIEHKVISGKTGYNNINDDRTCIIYYNLQENCIVVSFHGSRSGNMTMGAFYNNGEGDWGANYDFAVVRGDFVGTQGQQLRHMPADIELHRGFTNNFLSAQDELLGELDILLTQFQGRTPWIIVTGHSKGGAMASIAAPVIKLHLKDTANIGALLFSSPRAIHGDASRQWVHKILGKRNILRIHVDGDPATQMPRETFGYSYRSLGMLALDFVSGVDSRMEQLGYLAVKSRLGRYHYGYARKEGFGYEPKIALPFKDLLPALEAGRKNMSEMGSAIMTTSFVQK